MQSPRSRFLRRALDPTRAHRDLARAALRERRSCVTSTSVMPRSRRLGEQQVDDLRPVASSRLPVGSSAIRMRRIGRERAGDRDALLLAAGELRRIMGDAVAEPDRRRAPAAARANGVGDAPASSSGTATFSSAVMVGIRWKDWKTMPICGRGKRASSSSLLPAEVLAGDRDRAAIDPFQPGDHHQQRRFARARRPDDADRLAARHIEARCPSGRGPATRRRPSVSDTSTR